MKKTAILVLALVLVVGLVAVQVAASTDQPFNYTITATGTEEVTTYPDQEFNWTATITGTETITSSGPIGQTTVSCSGYQRVCNEYLPAPAGKTIKGWTRDVYYSEYGGHDYGTYISGNVLYIEMYSGGYLQSYQYQCGTHVCGSYCCSHDWLGYCDEWCNRYCPSYCTGYHNYGGYYRATYYIYGDTQETKTVTSTVTGSGVVNADDGVKSIDSFTLLPPPPTQGGTVTIDEVTITCDNPEVTVATSCAGGTCQVVASTGVTETATQPWSDTETGSATVNADEGDKYITTSTLVAPNGDTDWSVTDDNPQVATRMDGPDLYAVVPVEPRMIAYRWGKPAPGYTYCKWPIFEAWLAVKLENAAAGDAFNVTASIMGQPANVTVPDPDVAFGDILAGEEAWSTDTFTVQVDMAHPVDPDEGVVWRIEYDDAAGVHHVVENVPQVPPE